MRRSPTLQQARVAPSRCTQSLVEMNLTVASRKERDLMHFHVEGRWRNGDALKLAYFVKAAVSRVREDHVLIDLRQVSTPADADGKFLICDRLRRALSPSIRVGLVGTPDLVDSQAIPMGLPHCPDIALFGAETEAIRWLGK